MQLRHTNTKSKRLEARISTEQKRLFQHAANLLGQSLTDFAINILQKEAKKIIKEHEIMQLFFRDQEIFIDAMLRPHKPNKRLQKAVKHYNNKAPRDENA
ncbi:MAG: DUF1778 domain-containing protein [Gammaproteobacteria bacterium]|jgi:uncharacterized protein (DUF1778 family)